MKSRDAKSLKNGVSCFLGLLAISYFIFFALPWLVWGVGCAANTEFEGETRGFERRFLPGYVARLQERVHQWFLFSLILAMAFLPQAYFDWEKMSISRDGGDARYLFFAILDQLTWIGTWTLLSLPLIKSVQHWRTYKVYLLLTTHGDVRKDLQEQLELVEPISNLEQLGIYTSAAVAFLLPVMGIWGKVLS